VGVDRSERVRGLLAFCREVLVTLVVRRRGVTRTPTEDNEGETESERKGGTHEHSES
jgi:hypothetical protein